MTLLPRHILPLLLLVFLGSTQGLRAAEITTFESCTDVRGRSIPVVTDSSLPVLVQAGSDGMQQVIRYNPSLLPRLKPATRLFFFAHECARLSLDGPDDTAKARRADCIGLATLVDAGLVKQEALADLQADLSFSAEEWRLLPGPPRSFELSACPAHGGVRLPAATAPGEKQADWNACVHRCGDQLYHCGKGCSGAACDSHCMEPYRQCVAACNE